MGNIKTKSNQNKILIYFITAIAITAIILIKMSDTKNFKDFPYTKLFGICDQSQQQYPEKFKEKWGK